MPSEETGARAHSVTERRSSGPCELELAAREGVLSGQHFPLAAGMILGRGLDTDILVPDSSASRRHATIVATEGGLAIEDMRSHNGTYVNGVPVARHVLAPGDLLRVGDSVFEVRCARPEAPANGSSGILRRGRPVRTTVWREDCITTPTLERLSTGQFVSALGMPESEGIVSASPDDLRRFARKGRSLAVVYGITKVLGAARSLADVEARALKHLMEATGAEAGHIVLADAGRRTEELSLTRAGDGTITKRSEGFSRSVAEWIIENRSAIITPDASRDGRLPRDTGLGDPVAHSALCVPLLSEGTAVGAVALERATGSEFSEADLELVAVVAPMLAISIENARLRDAERRMFDELREAHEKLLRAQEELVTRERVAVVGRFASGIAHDIRNTLGAFSLLEELLEDGPPPSTLQEDAALMWEAYRHLLMLVDEIRLMARGEDEPFEPALHDLSDTVTKALAIVRCDRTVRSQRISWSAGAVPPFRYDDRRMKQVFVHLVRNAAQAMEDPGSIGIRATVVRDGGDWVRIDVVDDGPGIAPEVLPRIWEPFFTTRPELGAGLGLDVCRRIVGRHGGRLACTSALGEGTTMSVLLPL